jgi:translation initiation factor IF-2
MGGQEKRLNKVAKEFNISITTIVDFLHIKGIAIDSNPNTKIESTILSILDQQFKDDKVAKQNSETVDIGREKRESISLKDVKKETVPSDDDDDDDDYADEKPEVKIFQKPYVPPVRLVEEKIAEKPPVEVPKIEPVIVAEKAVETPMDEPQKGGVSILGKIDLDALNQKTRPAKKKFEPYETPKVTPKLETPVVENVQEQKVDKGASSHEEQKKGVEEIETIKR